MLILLLLVLRMLLMLIMLMLLLLLSASAISPMMGPVLLPLVWLVVAVLPVLLLLRRLLSARPVLVGLDIIGECVTEINVTSPTCFQEIYDQTGCDVAALFLDALEQELSDN